MQHIAEVIFGAVGTVFSIIHGLKYADIWDMKQTKTMPLAWQASQVWRNFAGSAVGWLIAGYYVFRRVYSPHFPQVGDAVPMLIAFAGVIGFLPRALFNWSGK